MPEGGEDQKMSNPENSEFIINRDDKKIFGPEKDHEVGYKNWLVDDKEIENIKNKRLQGIIRQLNKLNPQKLNSDFLLSRYAFLQDEFSELENEPIDDFLAKIYTQVEDLQNKEDTKARRSMNIDSNLNPLVDKISEVQENLLNAFKSQQMTLEQFLNLSQKQTQNLSESFKRVPVEEERDRWLDVEYRQEFYTRFTPSLEPRFYTELNDEKERRLFDARWQLARAAYYKKATSGSPEKMIDNQDLILLKTEQMEQLYNMPGVKKALEWYVNLIVNKEKVEMSDGRKIDIFQCENESDFEDFRGKMRKEALLNIKLTNSEKKEADAVAWNWMWISNLMESADSRYSSSGGRHNVAGDLVSDDLRAVFHPQEKFENKLSAKQEWGVFGKWGNVQLGYIEKMTKDDVEKKIKEIEEKPSFNDQKDKVKQQWVFEGAKNLQEFWQYKGINIEEIKKENGGRVIFVNRKVIVPECYPTNVFKSFWEEISDDNKKNLLQYLKNKEEIPWRELHTGLWVGYLPIKLNKAVKLLDDYFKGKAKLIEGKENVWVDPLRDIFVRLGLDKNKKDFHNLKIWSVYTGFGEILNPDSKLPTFPLRFMDRTIMEERLRRPDVRFLERGERLSLSY